MASVDRLSVLRRGRGWCAGICLVLAAAGCSHTTPYYRGGSLAPMARTVGEADIRQRILLVGDAGDTEPKSDTFAVLRRYALASPERTVIVFLGDNIYPAGLPAEGHAEREPAERRLAPQLDAIAQTGARGVFLSGNHDWADDGPGGLEAVRRQEVYVRRVLGDRGSFLPRNGLSGPATLDLDGVRLVVLNTSWWLHEEGAAACENPSAAKGAMLKRLETMLASAGSREVVVLAHHPLVTYGSHGGFYDLKDHLFPIVHVVPGLWIPTPVLGSLYPLLRSCVYNTQSLSDPAYKEMRERLTPVLARHKPLLYAAGHDHSLQVIEGGQVAGCLLVSALGRDMGSALGHGDDTLFAHLHPGFMVVDFLKGGEVLLRVVEPARCEVVFWRFLSK